MPKIINLPTEVLRLVVVELSLEHDRDLDYNFRERNKIRRKHLAQLAGTCRRFYDIVKPILWRRHWKEALVSSIKFARHDIIDFLADNRSTLVLEGLDAGANCFDYHFSNIDHSPTYDYCDDEDLALSEKKNGNKKPVYPAIIVAAMHAYPNQDTAATAIHLITKGQANPYVPSRNCCKCLSPPARRINGSSGWQSMLHTILCPESSSMEYAAFMGRYGIVHYMLRDIQDFDLTQAYWGPCLLSQLIRRSTPLNGAREHLSDIIDLLVTRYGLDVNGGPSSEGGITSRPLHIAIWNELLHNFSYSHSYYDKGYNLDTISHLFRLGADPSLAAPNPGPDRRHPPGSTLRPVTAMGAFLLVWTERRINPKHEPWNWRPMADLLVSNGARCHFDGNWESPGLFDFEYFMDALDIACNERDADMLRLLVDDLAPTLQEEGLFTPQLWEQYPGRLEVSVSSRFHRHGHESVVPAEWWTTRGVEVNWSTYFAERSRNWVMWQVYLAGREIVRMRGGRRARPVQPVRMRFQEWVEGISLLAKLPFSADDA